jgi:hypothetical protein
MNSQSFLVGFSESLIEFNCISNKCLFFSNISPPLKRTDYYEGLLFPSEVFDRLVLSLSGLSSVGLPASSPFNVKLD